MRTDEQFRNDVFERANRYKANRIKTRKKIIAGAVPFVLVVVVALFVFPVFSNNTTVKNDKVATSKKEEKTEFKFKKAETYGKGESSADISNDENSTNFILDDGVYAVLFDDTYLDYEDAKVVDKIINNAQFSAEVKSFEEPVEIYLISEGENLLSYEYSKNTGVLRFNQEKYATLNEEEKEQIEKIIRIVKEN